MVAPSRFARACAERPGRRYCAGMPRAADDPDAPLKRLGGGRWQSRDERFTIEPQSGTWVIVDAAQTDELGLPLVRGPFGSLTAAKAAMAEARTAEPPSSPLEGRAPRPSRDDDPATTSGPAARRGRGKPEPARASASGAAPEPEPQPKPQRRPAPPEPPEPPEPRWLRELAPEERRRARRAIDRLTEAGAVDPEGIVRRDAVGDVPAIAAWAVTRALRAAGPKATPVVLAALLADGRDAELGVRWHLVDGDGRRIQLDPDALDDPDPG